jgi:hypothetical protein
VTDQMRKVMRYLRGLRIVTPEAAIKIDKRQAVWMAKVAIVGDSGETLALIKERIIRLLAKGVA